jgi:hypothetical protein
MMEEVQKPSNSECYTPSSGPFKIYLMDDDLERKDFGLIEVLSQHFSGGTKENNETLQSG